MDPETVVSTLALALSVTLAVIEYRRRRHVLSFGFSATHGSSAKVRVHVINVHWERTVYLEDVYHVDGGRLERLGGMRIVMDDEPELDAHEVIQPGARHTRELSALEVAEWAAAGAVRLEARMLTGESTSATLPDFIQKFAERHRSGGCPTSPCR